MKAFRSPKDIPEENILDLRSPKEAEVNENPKPQKTKPEGHVDFLSLVENSENALWRKFKVWFASKGPEAGTSETETDQPKQSRRSRAEKPFVPSAGQTRIPYGQVVRFSISLGVVAILIFGASYLGRLEIAKGEVLGASTEALNRLAAAGAAAQNMQFGITQTELAAAQAAFLAAQSDLENVAGVLKNLPGLGKIQSADKLLKAGQAVVQASSFLAESAGHLVGTPVGTTALIQVLQEFDQALKPAMQSLQVAADNLAEVNPEDLPESAAAIFIQVQQQLPSLTLQFQRLTQVGDFLKSFLAADNVSHRYIFAFQNNNELRPTGGFLGSLALAEIRAGQVEKIEVPSGGIYDLSGQTSLKLIAPKPLHLVQANWNLQDANWSPDFPTSAKKILDFYDSATNTAKVEGIVAITPAVLESFLALTGPVEVPEVEETFTAENVVRKIQENIKEAEKKDYTKPKLVLGYLAPKILARAFELDQAKLWQMLGSLQNHLIERDIQFFFTDPTLQKQASDLGWAGEIRKANRDFLMINRANLGGGKTDGVIEEIDVHNVSVSTDGTLTTTLNIIRKHTGLSADKFTGDRNVTYLRVYVPKGSQLISASGFEKIDPKRFMAPLPDRLPDPEVERLDAGAIIHEASGTKISEELGYTVFGNWLGVGVGETAKASLTYVLPFKFEVGGLFNRSDEYSFLVQKQPGTNPAFTSTLTAPADWQAVWSGSTAKVFVPDNSSWRMSADLLHDEYYGVVLKK